MERELRSRAGSPPSEVIARHCRRSNMEVEVLTTDGYGLLAEVRVGNQVLGVMDAFSMIRPEQLRSAEPEFSCLGL